MTRVYIEECRLSNGLVVHSDSRTPVQELYKDIYKKRVYSPEGFPEIKPHDVVVDLGANIGMFALYAASISSTVHVYAFEPASRSFILLQENARTNNLANIQCCRLSVSASTGRESLYIVNTGSTADTTINSRIPSQGVLEVETIDCLSLNDLFARYAIEKCHFMKVDVEGSEFKIFSSASPEVLKRIEKIAMEYHENGSGQGQQLVYLLQNVGYEVAIKPESGSDRGMIYAIR